MWSKKISAALLALVLIPVIGSAGDAKEKDESQWKGSVAIPKCPDEKDLVGLAKISFDKAMQIALKAAPGSVIKGEIEVEQHALIYSFDILSVDKKVMEVVVDAGNGKVLEVGSDEEDDEDEKD